MQTNNESRVLDREPVVVDRSARALYALATRVAATDCTVLINGESGTGKEVLARYIHDRSPRVNAPFIAINCAAIPRTCSKPCCSATSAAPSPAQPNAHAGKFEQAQGGTLLLDEITEMPLSLQAKLLRVLQEREVERLGARAMMNLDVRVLATTNRNLREQVQMGSFREDLYYRLCVFPMTIPALRERRDDVLPLAMRLLEMRSARGARIPALSADAAQLLLTYTWPGNIRETRQPAAAGDDPRQRPGDRSRAHPFRELARGHAGARGQRATGHGDRHRRPAVARYVACRRRPDPHDRVACRRESPRVARKLGISPRTLRYKLAQLRSAGVDVPAA